MSGYALVQFQRAETRAATHHVLTYCCRSDLVRDSILATFKYSPRLPRGQT